jgi:hypothetical protein
MDRRQRKDPRHLGRAGGTVRHGGAGPAMNDAASQALRRAGGLAGNRDLAKHLRTPEGRRDAMVEFICERLRRVRDAQLVEQREWADRSEWVRAVERGRKGAHLPDPGRWAECAAKYQEAMKALCAGNLARGAQLLEQAVAAERSAFDSLPDAVKEELVDGQAAPEEMPEAADNAGPDDRCDARSVPAEFKLADRIQAAQPTIRDVFFRMGRPHHWFDQEEEEEDDEKKKEGKKA